MIAVANKTTTAYVWTSSALLMTTGSVMVLLGIMPLIGVQRRIVMDDAGAGIMFLALGIALKLSTRYPNRKEKQ